MAVSCTTLPTGAHALEIRLNTRHAALLTTVSVALLSGCKSQGPTAMEDTDAPAFTPSKTEMGVSAVTGSTSSVIPAPVLKVVHHAINTPASKTYYSMVSPFPANSSTTATGRFDVRMTTFKQQWSLAPRMPGMDPDPVTTAMAMASERTSEMPLLGMLSPVHGSGVVDFNAIVTTTTAGQGWVYTTGDKPIVKTRRIILAADGTTFFCQVGQRNGTEYHRAALLFPTGAPNTDTVRIALCATPDVTEITLTFAQPYAVYEYVTGTGVGTWTQSESIGTGNLWDNFQDALNSACQQAVQAELPTIP